MIAVVVTLSTALLGVVAFLVYREWYHTKHLELLEKRYFDERQFLLDRLMARDFAEYKQAELATKAQAYFNPVSSGSSGKENAASAYDWLEEV